MLAIAIEPKSAATVNALLMFKIFCMMNYSLQMPLPALRQVSQQIQKARIVYFFIRQFQKMKLSTCCLGASDVVNRL